jgi:hypothetical protein
MFCVASTADVGRMLILFQKKFVSLNRVIIVCMQFNIRYSCTFISGLLALGRTILLLHSERSRSLPYDSRHCLYDVWAENKEITQDFRFLRQEAEPRHSEYEEKIMIFQKNRLSAVMITYGSKFEFTYGVKVKFVLYQAPKAQRGSRGIALLIRDLGSRGRWVVSITPRPLYPLERPGTHCTEGWAGPRASITCAKNLAPTGIRSTDPPVTYGVPTIITSKNPR